MENFIAANRLFNKQKIRGKNVVMYYGFFSEKWFVHIYKYNWQFSRTTNFTEVVRENFIN